MRFARPSGSNSFLSSARERCRSGAINFEFPGQRDGSGRVALALVARLHFEDTGGADLILRVEAGFAKQHVYRRIAGANGGLHDQFSRQPDGSLVDRQRGGENLAAVVADGSEAVSGPLQCGIVALQLDQLRLAVNTPIGERKNTRIRIWPV